MFYQPIPTVPLEPILIGASLVGGGGVLIWFARAIIETRDTVRRVAVSLYEDTTGLIHVVYKNRHETVAALGELSNEQVEIDKRLSRVEDRCELRHPNHGRSDSHTE